MNNNLRVIVDEPLDATGTWVRFNDKDVICYDTIVKPERSEP